MRKLSNVSCSKFKYFLMAFVLFFSSFFNFDVEAAADPLITCTSSGSKTVAYTTTNNFNGYFSDFFTDLKSFFDQNLEAGCFYKVDYDALFTLQFRTAGILNSADLNFEFYKSNGPTAQRINLIQQTSSITCATNTPYSLDNSGYIIIHADDLNNTYYTYQYNFNYGATTNANILSYQYNIKLNINGLTKLSDSEAEIYQRGYDEGYFIGFESGYSVGKNQGLDIGYNEGFQDGYDAAFDEGYKEGNDAGYNAGLESGFDSGYDKGFDDGAASVDTDSFYQAGYNAGLDSGFNEAFQQGYAEGVSFGYTEGFNAAKDKIQENIESTGTSAGDTFVVNQALNLKKSQLKLSDSNTLLSPVYEYVADEDTFYIYDREYYPNHSDAYDTDGDGLNDEWFYDIDFDYTDLVFFDSIEAYQGWSYFYTGAMKIFTADPAVYAYKIKVTPSNISSNLKNINWARNTVGQWSDIMAGISDIGIGLISGYSDSFTYFITTDNLPVDIYSAALMYFYNEGYQGTEVFASYDITGSLKFEITPYSRNEFASVLNGIDDLQDDLNSRFEGLEENLNDNFKDLMNSFDSSQGDLVNDNFQASLNDYETAENSLFNTAKESLGAYEFFDFNSVPAMVTGISFVTSVMTSIYTALGGVSGASGIILSILFSVMLVSMIIGLSKHYQSGSRRSGGSSNDKPTRSSSDHIKK